MDKLTESILWKDISWTNPEHVELKLLNDFAFNKFDEDEKAFQALSHFFLDSPLHMPNNLFVDDVEYKGEIASLMYWKSANGAEEYFGYLIRQHPNTLLNHLQCFFKLVESKMRC